MKKTLLLTSILMLGFVFMTVGSQAQDIPKPNTVTIAGTIQSQLGCSDDWQPECEATFLTDDGDNDIWTIGGRWFFE